ncbi:MAG: protein rnfH [Comamonas sp. SCN 65-56]|uniref:RnfH family protein n=1 Tax=Comamonas sp. SCN 65-56 TaxID=1660095 RepID=UPI00086E9705|nr:RnfH family protein [Comamonas sp. SCN 65-56]ODS92351.1 MAG: protein rnfH [Comamonas sp. SCN 65-56]
MADERISVVVVASPGPRQTREWALELAIGSTVADALKACGLDRDDSQYTCGIWGRAVALDALLCSGDRVEWCRPLRVDPKVARRERFARQGARATGLFARRSR